MAFRIFQEQSFGKLPTPYTISQILQIKSDSKEIIEVYDTNPNLVALLNSDEGGIVLKRFGWRSQFHFLISPFMYSRARMSWNTAIILDSVRITPKPLFVHTKKKFGFKHENFFVTEAIEPHIKFRKMLKEETNSKKIKTVIKKLAIAIAKMHELGIYHRDLTTGNFLVNDSMDIFIVDLNRAKNVRKLSLNQRFKDISKIYFKNTEIFSQKDSINHFFNYYSKESGIKNDCINEYWKYRKKLVNRRKRSKKYKNLYH